MFSRMAAKAAARVAAPANPGTRSMVSVSPKKLALAALADDEPISNASEQDHEPSKPMVVVFDTGIPNVPLFVANDGPLQKARPGNGGLRIWEYEDNGTAINEARDLAAGMTHKHVAFNTGCSGAKLVVNAAAAGGVDQISKVDLLDGVARALQTLDGTTYTGCDLNTSMGDCEYLNSKTPYVLASIGAEHDANVATGMGVVGAAKGWFEHRGESMKGKTFLVHGAGNVGATVAEELAALGAEVLVTDKVADRCDISGCTNVAGSNWTELEFDVLMLCSTSWLMTDEVVAELTPRCKVAVAATNLPFATPSARNTFESTADFIPEGIASAGAVIVDSIEMFDKGSYHSAAPADIYDFTMDIVREKTVELCSVAEATSTTPTQVMKAGTVAADPDGPACGSLFAAWSAKKQNIGVAAVRGAGIGGATQARALHSTGARHPFGARAMSTAAQRAGVDTTDVAILGGGIMGLSTAYQLKRRSPDLRVTVYEGAPALGFGSSGYSTGFMRAFYSFDETMRLALDGIDAYKSWGEFLATENPEAYFTKTGALWMLGKSAEENAAMKERLSRFGVASTVVDEAGFASKFPLLSTEPMPKLTEDGDLEYPEVGPLSALYEEDAGHMDSTACLRDVYAAAVRDGVEIKFGTRARSVLTSESTGAYGVEFEDDSTVHAPVVLNTTGPWCNKLNDQVGVELTTKITPIRIQVAHKAIEGDFLDLPFVADGHGESGIYFMPRRANNQLVFGSVAHRFESEEVDPDSYDTNLDPDFKQDYLNCLLHRLPTLPKSGEVVGFSSMYTVNTDDVHPVIGESRTPGFWVCNGFSGHGFKLAPAVGSLLAQAITGDTTDKWDTSVPIDFFSAFREPLTLKVKTHFA